MPVNPVPEGYRSVIPYLIVDGAAKAIDFYVDVFGGEEVMRYPKGDKIGHAEIKIGDAHIMLADEFPEMDYRAPTTIDSTGSGVMLYLPDVDSVFARAVERGAKALREVEDQFYGDRSATILDPFGHRWMIATHVEDVSPEEMERRMAAMPEAAEA